MAKAAEILEIPATITERGQTTVPAAIRRMLALGKRDRVVFRGMADGTVVIAKKDAESGDADPVIGKFLAFLAGDMVAAPRRIQPVSPDLVARGAALVAGVEVDLDEALPDDEA
ncbi:MAG TPA: type II toxin-antitoxin system PrlF family antitoxin [Ancylobacter sp.]